MFVLNLPSKGQWDKHQRYWQAKSKWINFNVQYMPHLVWTCSKTTNATGWTIVQERQYVNERYRRTAMESIKPAFQITNFKIQFCLFLYYRVWKYHLMGCRRYRWGDFYMFLNMKGKCLSVLGNMVLKYLQRVSRMIFPLRSISVVKQCETFKFSSLCQQLLISKIRRSASYAKHYRL